ncbi:FliM/FliN family flagellar motor switch protein [Falsihalocynthiibacter sp. SS001]|uniref:FliM/FliN family flagellar motor switch protein n=1 Tax=Falsihalocynthiibacter sp. SS001 TaxID=3349698 RepID=UPI0036D37E42
MSSDTLKSALQRLIAKNVEPEVDSAARPMKVLQDALPKAADHSLELPLVVARIDVAERPRDMLIEVIEQGRLYILVQAADGRMGLAVPDSALLAAVIEIQTMGEVTSFGPTERKPTRTDASMIEPLIAATLSELSDTGQEELARLAGFSFGRLIEEHRHLALVLEQDEYWCFDIQADLGRVAKRGRLLLCFPTLPPEVPQEDTAESEHSWSATLEANVMEASVQIDAELHSFDLPLDQLAKLQVGDHVDIPREAIGRLKVKGGGGDIVATGRLGQANGRRAVRFMGLAGEDMTLDVVAEAPHPLELMGSGAGPTPVTATDAVLPVDISLPEDFAPPDDGDDLDMPIGKADFSAPLGDLPDLNFDPVE